MNPRLRAILQILIVLVAVAVLVSLFKPAAAFVEMAARELRYFWWLIFIILLAVWLIWGFGRKRK